MSDQFVAYGQDINKLINRIAHLYNKVTLVNSLHCAEKYLTRVSLIIIAGIEAGKVGFSNY